MDLKSILNLTLLALSLSTVLITIVSFILFKIKQLSIRKLYRDPNRLDGVFFIRYAPHLEIVNIKAREIYKLSNRNKGKTSIKSVAVLFFMVVTIIVSVLVSESYIGDLFERRKKMSQAENYRGLIEKGLLRKIDFIPSYKKSDFKEVLSESTKKNIAYIVRELQNKKIVLLDSKANAGGEKKVGNSSSFSDWETFLQQYKIPYTFDSFENLTDSLTLIIIDNQNNLKLSDLSKLEALVKKGVSVLFTRNLAVEKKSDQPELNKFITKYLGLSFISCKSGLASTPTLLSADRAPFWNIPGGYLINWKNQASQCAFSTDTQVVVGAYEGNFEGDIKKISEANPAPIVRVSFKDHGRAQVGWMAFAPTITDLDDADVKAADINGNVVMLSTLGWFSAVPIVKMPALPQTAAQPLIMSFEYSGEQKYLERALSEFIDEKRPFTFFLENDKLALVKDILKGNDLSLIDFSAQFKSISMRKIDSLSIDKEYFDLMQENRLNLEEEASVPVVGLKLDPDVYNESTLYTALENKFSYILGGGYEQSNRVFMFTDKFIRFFQPTTINKFDSRVNKQVGNSDSFKKLFDKIKTESAMLGLPYMYHANNLNVINLDNLKYVLKEAANKKFDVFNYKQMHSWFELRQNILVDISNDGNGVYSIYIKNNNDTKVDDLHILTSKNLADIEKDNSLPAGVKKMETNKIQINTLAPAQEMTLKVKFL